MDSANAAGRAFPDASFNKPMAFSAKAGAYKQASKDSLPPLREKNVDRDPYRAIQIWYGDVPIGPEHFQDLANWCIEVGEEDALVWLFKNASVCDLSFDKQDPKAMASLANALGRDVNIKNLDIRVGDFTEQMAACLSHALANNKGIKTLAFTGARLDAKAVEHLAAGLASNSSLESLDLSGAVIERSGWDALLGSLEGHASLTGLRLCSQKIKSGDFPKIMQGLQKANQIERLDLESSALETHDVDAIVKYLNEHPGLKAVGFSNLGFSDTDGRAILNSLKENPSLAELRMDGNSMGSGCATAVGELLRLNNQLKKLSLKDNGLDNDNDIREIAKGLEQNGGLTDLDISSNEFGVAGGLAIADALSKNSTLTHLNMDYADIDSDQPETAGFCEAIIRNETIVEFSCSLLELSEDHIQQVEGAIARNRQARLRNERDAALYNRI